MFLMITVNVYGELTTSTTVYGPNYFNNIQLLLDVGDIDEAEKEINKFVQDNPSNPETIWLKSMLSFYTGDYKSAKDGINKILETPVTAKHVQWSENYSYFSELVKISENFQEFTTSHFILRLKPEDLVLKEYALESLEKMYTTLGNQIGVYPERKIVVEVQSSREDFLVASTLTQQDVDNSGAIGICKFNRLIIVSPRCLTFGYRWLDTLSHEYVHYLVNRATRYNCPLWLHEGIARYHDTLWRSEKSLYFSPSSEHLLAEAYKNKKLVSFDRMEPSMVKLDNQEQVALAFAEVSNTVDYMIKTYGKEKLTELLQTLKLSRDRIKPFQKVFGVSILKIEQDWRNTLAKSELESFPGVAIDKKEWKDKSGDEIDTFVGTDVRGYIRLGDKFRIRKKYEWALQEYNQALEQEPNNPLILNKVTKMKLVLGQFEEAENNLRKAISTNPDYGGSYPVLAELLISQNKFDEAANLCREAIAINPFNPEVHKKLGYCYYRLGNLTGARTEWENTLKLVSNDYETQGWLNQLP